MSTMSKRLRAKAVDYRRRAEGLEIAARVLEREEEAAAGPELVVASDEASPNGAPRKRRTTAPVATAPPATRAERDRRVATVLQEGLSHGPQRIAALIGLLKRNRVGMTRTGVRAHLLRLGAQSKGRSRSAVWMLAKSGKEAQS